MKKLIVLISMVLALCFALAACGNNASSSDQAPSSDSNAAQSSSDGVADKKGSGKVTVYMPSPAGLVDKQVAEFEKQTGIKVEVFQGTTGEILARLEAEKANPVADVVVLASWSDGLTLKNQDKLASYTPKRAGEMVKDWIDPENTLFGYSASAVGVIYNTTIFPEMNADWSELADAQYKDQLAIPDPEKSGACKDFVANYVAANGWDDFEAMAANGMIVPGANKAALEAVTTGEVGVLVAGVDYNAFKSIDKGEPLQIYYPKGGTVVNPRPAMIMKEAPNPENAQAFIDFLLSDESQKMVVDAYLLPGIEGIEQTNRIPLKDIPQIEPNWEESMKTAAEDAQKINKMCSK